MLYINREKDGSDSIIYHDPFFFTTLNDKIFLLKIQTLDDWKGTSQKDLKTNNWKAPRLQRWSHMLNNRFNKDWSEDFDRWLPMPYHSWMKEWTLNIVERLDNIFDLVKSKS